jgi:hypothetical protein
VRARRAALAALALALTGCTREAGAPERGPPAPARAPAAPARSSGSTPPRVALADRAALAVIAARGGSLTALVGARGVADLAAAVAREVERVAAGDPLAGVGIRRHAHRLFDVGWLTGDPFELTGVVFRVDRIPATPGACGDVRLLYRLAPTIGGVVARLPMTLSVVLAGEPRDPRGGCLAAAARWMLPTATSGRALGEAFVAPGGPLGDGRLAPARVGQLLVDLQASRWPSKVMPDLGGHAEYVLFTMTPKDGGLALGQASMTPDVEAIARDPALARTLDAWLRTPATLDAIELGLAALPAELLARRSVAVSPGGFARIANRPFRRLLEPAALADLPLAGRAVIGSPEALIRRLDEMTCAGCHQARALAGFHWLGDDPAEQLPGNALAEPRSPHMIAEVARRAALVADLAAGRAVDYRRPFAERDPAAAGGLGAHCGLGDVGFAAWTCGDGLACLPLEAPHGERTVGACAATPAAVGDSCDVGPIASRADPRRDRMRARRRACAAGATCTPRRQGFPAGACLASCAALPAGSACGVIASTGFDRCMLDGPFERCLRANVRRVGLAACDAARPCRDDYLCGRMPGGGGACVPPYFLFQLRVDGH